MCSLSFLFERISLVLSLASIPFLLALRSSYCCLRAFPPSLLSRIVRKEFFLQTDINSVPCCIYRIIDNPERMPKMQFLEGEMKGKQTKKEVLQAATADSNMRFRLCVLVLLVCMVVGIARADDEVYATGNEWIALPDIQTSDASLQTFNVIYWRRRGLLEVQGEAETGRPAIQPYFLVNGVAACNGSWEWDLLGNWIPRATQQISTGGGGGVVEISITYCAPPGYRAALIRLTVTNQGAAPVNATLGILASFGSLSRVTYEPVLLGGDLKVQPALWVDDGEVFSYVEDDTEYAWSFLHTNATADIHNDTRTPSVDAFLTSILQPGESFEGQFILGVGVEEFSAGANG